MAKNIVTLKLDGTSYTPRPYGTCDTAAGTAAKAVTCADFKLVSGATVLVKFTNANSASTPTLNVNSTGAKNIFNKGSQITSGGNKALLAGIVEFYYDGTQWQLVGNYIDTNTTYSSKTAASGGTDVSLVTTGEKYTWNNKASTSVVSTSANGLMSSTDKIKLNKTNIAYGTCSTAAATAAKVVTLADNTGWALNAGSIVSVLFTNSNSASNPTLNVNSTGARNIFYNTSQITTSSLTYAGYANRVATYMYDGTQYRFITWAYDANSTYSQASLGQGYGTCDTAAGTAAKVVTLSGYSLATGGIVSVKFTNAVDASSTMNINSKGAKSIYFKGAAITANIIPAGAVATFIYNGSQYHLIGLDVPRVSISRSLTSGTKIGTITIDGTGTDLYCQTNTNTTYSAGNGLTLSSTTFNVGAGTGISVAADTVGISDTYQTYISNGNTAYGWGNHANAGYTKNTGTVTSVATGKGLTGGTITGSGTIKCNLNSETSLGTIGTTSKLYAVGVDANNKLCVNVPWTDNNTTYSSKAAASGGTDVSLVTTGEKYTWNSKTSNTGTVTSITLSAGTGISLDSTSAITTSGTRTISLASGVLGTGTAGTQYGPTAAVTGNNNSTINVPYLKVDTYGRVTTVGHFALTCKNTTYSAATTSANGLMSSTDKSRLDYMHSSQAVTTLASLPAKAIVTATLSAATNISLASALTVGQSITVICTPTADFTQPLPTSGSFVSMDGDSLSVTNGVKFEINILCYASGSYSISCKTAV